MLKESTSKAYLFIWFLFLSNYHTQAQQLVKEIEFSGLKKTKESHLLRFISHKVGEPLDYDLLKKDEQQLRNVISVVDAKSEIDTLAAGVKITFQIEEAITFFPIINFGGLEDNIWFQLGATEHNLLGRGIQVTAYYQNNDRRHNGELFLRVPYVKGSRWGGTFGLRRWASIEPLFFDKKTVYYSYDNNAISGSFIRELRLNHTIELGASYFEETYEKDARHDGEVTPGPESARLPKLLYKLSHNLDRRNYHSYILSGWYLEQHLQFVQTLNDQDIPLFWIGWTDFHVYLRTGRKNRTNIVTRMRFGLSENSDSPFAPFVLDSHVNIRGSGNRIDRGTGSFVWNVELRNTIFDQGNFAAQGVLFSDFGSWRKPGGSFNELVTGETTEHFLGAGIRLIYKKMHNAIFRADYGFNRDELQNNGWVLGIGQYF